MMVAVLEQLDCVQPWNHVVPEGIVESDFRNLTNEATAVYHPRTFTTIIVQYSYSH